MASSLCLTVMTLILLLTFVSSTISSRSNRKEYWRDVRGKVDGSNKDSIGEDAKQDLGGHDEYDKLAHIHIHGSHSSAPHMDHHMMKEKDLVAFKIFFTSKELKLGSKMPLYFPSANISPLFSREEADSIPFSMSKLSNLLQIFSISRGAPQAEAIERTLRDCEMKPVEGETKFCATSFESMLDFVRSVFAFSSSSSFSVLSSKIHRSPSQVAVLENYTIVEEPVEIWVSKQVGCHPSSYPYAVFYCHQTSNTKLYKVLLIGELSGEKVEGVAVCHMDTSLWNPNLTVFQVLGIKPGTEPVCHFFLEGNLLFIPSNLIASY